MDDIHVFTSYIVDIYPSFTNVYCVDETGEGRRGV